MNEKTQHHGHCGKKIIVNCTNRYISNPRYYSVLNLPNEEKISRISLSKGRFENHFFARITCMYKGKYPEKKTTSHKISPFHFDVDYRLHNQR